MKFPRLYPILDAQLALGAVQDRRGRLQQIIHELMDAGVEMLQYRNKRNNDLMSPSALTDEALTLREAVPPEMKLILNDYVSLVPSTGFDGVHIGQLDTSPAAARAALGMKRIVGISTHNEAQLLLADKELVDYIAFGPVFTTGSKQNPDPVVGLDGLRQARRLTSKPLVAIGGITLENAASVYEAGADSVALISAIFAATEPPGRIAKDFLKIYR
jgi:thiamine-phosphate pyrophosphorylase